MTRADSLPGPVGSASIAFCAGAGVLALEITAARVLVPYFGASIVVWSNVIGVTLLAVATGNFLGGRLADRWPSSRTLGALLIGAGLCSAAFPWIASSLAERYLPADLPLDIAFSILGMGSFVVALAALAPPLVLVGATSPFLVRAMAADGRVGRAAGWIAGSGTLGSLVGTWLPVHWTIPEYGSKATCVMAGGLLALVGAFCARKSKSTASIGAAAFCALSIGGYAIHGDPFGRPAVVGEVVAELETPYQYARVERDGTHTYLRLNEGLDSFHSLTVDGEILTGAYYDPFLLLPSLIEREGETFDIAILGFAAGTWGRQLLAAYADRSDLRIVGVELDPAIIELGRSHFTGLDDARLDVVGGIDARVFIAREGNRFELILVDTYASQVYVPFQTCSAEFFAFARERLTTGGVLAANLGGIDFTDPPLVAIVNTCASVFGPVSLERFDRGRNFILIAAREKEPPRLASAVDRAPARLVDLAKAQNAIGVARRFDFDSSGLVLTDDRSPIERLCDADLETRALAELDGRSRGRNETIARSSGGTRSVADVEALDSARAAAAADPTSLSALHRLAFLGFRLGDLDLTTRTLDDADAVDPTHPYTAFLRGIVAETRYDFAAAHEAYTDALLRDPNDATSRDELSALDRRIAAVARFATTRDRLSFDAILGSIVTIVTLVATVIALRRIPG